MTAYSNLRRDPFTSAYSYRAMDTEYYTIAEFDELPSRYGCQVQDRPETDSVVVTENITGGAEFVQVSTAPLAGQCRIDYNAGYIFFNVADVGTSVAIDYDGAGTNANKENIQSMVNNEPRIEILEQAVLDTGGLVDDMVVAQADILDNAALVPTGTIFAIPVSTAPSGFLECNGAAISKTTYAPLYTKLKDGGATCIYGEAGANFTIPDYRGRFPRGRDHGAGVDPDAATRTDRGDGTGGDNVGTKQADAFQGHFHAAYDTSAGGALSAYANAGDRTVITIPHDLNNSARDIITDGASGTPRTTSESRGININVMFVIKY